MATKIRWTDEENQLVALSAAEYLRDRLNSIVTNLNLLNAVRWAQNEMLHKNRRRSLKTYDNIKVIMPVLNLELNKLGIGCKTTFKAPPEPKSNPAPKPGIDVEEVAPIPVQPTLDLNIFFDLFIDRLVHRVVDVLEQRGLVVGKPVAESVPKVVGYEHPRIKKHVSQIETPRLNKLRIGVFGLLDSQQKRVSNKFPFVSFTFYERKLPKRLPIVDQFIGMVGFMDHSVDGRLNSEYNGKYIRLSNGITSLENQVGKLFADFNRS